MHFYKRVSRKTKTPKKVEDVGWSLGTLFRVGIYLLLLETSK